MSPKEKRELLKAGQTQLNKKLRLERKLLNRMRKFLKKQNRQVLEYARDFKMRFGAELNQEEIERILQDHYLEVISKFQDDVIKEANKAIAGTDVEKINKDDPVIRAAIAAFVLTQSKEGAQRIILRSNKDIERAFLASGNAEEIHRNLNQRILPRAKSIATEHTQIASEGGKHEIATATQRATQGAFFLAAKQLLSFKTWVTRMDNKVRDPHAMALFQEVRADKPFIVGGENLMYPGDSSLGASVWNLAHCRCVSINRFAVYDA